MKYTTDELREKAKLAIEALESGDPRFGLLVMMLSMATRVSEQECINRIREMAK